MASLFRLATASTANLSALSTRLQGSWPIVAASCEENGTLPALLEGAVLADKAEAQERASAAS
jgi:hypothetical protein